LTSRIEGSPGSEKFPTTDFTFIVRDQLHVRTIAVANADFKVQLLVCASSAHLTATVFLPNVNSPWGRAIIRPIMRSE
jgi:hypothetical protein